MSNAIPLAKPSLSEVERQAVLDVLRSPVLASGPRVEQFAKSVAELSQRNSGIPCSSGTAGLTLVLAALGIGAGDKVVVPAFGFVAMANAVGTAAGAGTRQQDISSKNSFKPGVQKVGKHLFLIYLSCFLLLHPAWSKKLPHLGPSPAASADLPGTLISKTQAVKKIIISIDKEPLELKKEMSSIFICIICSLINFRKTPVSVLSH